MKTIFEVLKEDAKTIIDFLKCKNRYIFIILCGLLLAVSEIAYKTDKQNKALKTVLDDQITQNMELSQKFDELSDSYSILQYNLSEQQKKNEELNTKIDEINSNIKKVEEKID